MKLLLHLFIIDSPVRFTNPLKIWVGNKFEEVTYFDVDSRSEALVLATTKEAIDKAEKILVVVEPEGFDSQVGVIAGILKKLAGSQNKKEIRIVQRFDHQVINKMRSPFHNWTSNLSLSELKKEVTLFFSN